MKVLFVGEGPHDIGSPEFAPHPRPATGVIPTLARKICPAIDQDCVGFFWREIPVLNREKKKRGFAAKVSSAILLAANHGCDGTVCVTDRDGDENRLPAMEEGIERGVQALGKSHSATCGIAVESIEAWILGAPTAIATALGEKKDRVLQEYKLADVEDFNQNSGKPEKRPKDILARIADLRNQKDGTEWRTEIAKNVDPSELTKNCPKGFEPFARKLIAAFGPRPKS